MTPSMCEKCKGWGDTVPSSYHTIIQCPDCKRNTAANLGVNCPAGSAVALSAVNHYDRMMQEVTNQVLAVVRNSKKQEFKKKPARQYWGQEMFKALYRGQKKRRRK